MLSSLIETIQILFVLGSTLAIYFAPSIAASRRNHLQKNPITIANLFFGWTLIGWVVCLAWSFSAHRGAR